MRLSTMLMFLAALFLLYYQEREGFKKMVGGNIDPKKLEKMKKEANKQAEELKRQMDVEVEKMKKKLKETSEKSELTALPELMNPKLIGSGQVVADKKTNFAEKGAPFNCKTKCLQHKGVGECEAGRCACLLSNGTKIYLDGECINHAVVEST